MLICVRIKKSILNLRLKPEVRDEFAIAADQRGASMSGLLHQFIVKTIREEKELAPQAFEQKPQPLLIEETLTKAEIERDYRLKEADVIKFNEAKPKKTDRNNAKIIGRVIERDVPEYDEKELKKIKMN